MFQGWELEPKTVTVIIFPDEQGLCVQTISVGSCMPLFGEGNGLLLALTFSMVNSLILKVGHLKRRWPWWMASCVWLCLTVVVGKPFSPHHLLNPGFKYQHDPGCPDRNLLKVNADMLLKWPFIRAPRIQISNDSESYSNLKVAFIWFLWVRIAVLEWSLSLNQILEGWEDPQPPGLRERCESDRHFLIVCRSLSSYFPTSEYSLIITVCGGLRQIQE